MFPSFPTLEPLVRRLELHTALSRDERKAVLGLPFEQRAVRGHTQLFRRTDPSSHCCVLLDGYAARYKLLRNGSRQILNVLMRGDLIGIQRTLFRRADHEIEMLTDGTVAIIAAANLEPLVSNNPTLLRALWSDTMYEGSIQREWTVNVGRRDAPARIAHLLCELSVRHEQQGLGGRDAFGLKLTQAHLADCAGLTGVHVNRVIRMLSDVGLLRRYRGHVTIADWAGLARAAGFDEQYLKPEVEVELSALRR